MAFEPFLQLRGCPQSKYPTVLRTRLLALLPTVPSWPVHAKDYFIAANLFLESMGLPRLTENERRAIIHQLLGMAPPDAGGYPMEQTATPPSTDSPDPGYPSVA